MGVERCDSYWAVRKTSRMARHLAVSMSKFALARFLNLRRFASNFAIWWDNLNEPEREGEMIEMDFLNSSLRRL